MIYCLCLGWKSEIILSTACYAFRQAYSVQTDRNDFFEMKLQFDLIHSIRQWIRDLPERKMSLFSSITLNKDINV